jgi:hypothetical protein
MAELERELRALGRELEFPPAPDLAPAIASRLAEDAARAAPPSRLWRPWRGRRALVLALALLLLAAATALALSPSLRDGIGDLFGLSGATVERTSAPPPPVRTAQPPPGRESSLPAARRTLAFEPVVPRDLGPPDAVFLARQPAGGMLSLGYTARPGLPEARTTGFGLLVSEFQGEVAPEFLTKIVSMTTRIDRLRIDGSRAVWIAGATHFFAYRSPSGRLRESELMVARNVLLVERGPLLVRLEGAMRRAEAIRIARGLR